MPGRVDEWQVRIEPWTEVDLELLRAANAPEMMVHLGGPETDDQVVARHARYLALNDSDTGQMFRIVLMPEPVAVGGIGLWDSEWLGEEIYETGWSVVPGHHGRGIATVAIGLVVAHARTERRHRSLHAFPSIDNAASNAVCRKTGFALLGERDFEYPPGSTMQCNDWRLDLAAPGSIRSGPGVRLACGGDDCCDSHDVAVCCWQRGSTTVVAPRCLSWLIHPP